MSRRQPLAQHGFTTHDLRIYLNADDYDTVQKFTLGHEFMEMLFFALEEGGADAWMHDDTFTGLMGQKEKLCDAGSAELVMPLALFTVLVREQPITLQRVSDIATHCQMSFTATIWRIIKNGLAPKVFIVWQFKHSPKEFVPSQVGQGVLFGTPNEWDPAKKMRVERAFVPPTYTGYIPTDKSVPPTSVISQAFTDGIATSGMEDIDLAGLRGRYFVEARPVSIDGERHIMSLIHLEGRP